MNPRRTFILIVAAIVAMMLSSPHYASDQTTLFFDDFNGPTLNPTFQASLPIAPAESGGVNLTYLGAPNYSFGTVAGASVLRLTTTMDNRQRVGWNTSTIFKVSDFRLEARFNVLVQSPTTSIDSFIEAWLIDAANSARNVVTGPAGQNYGLTRQLRGGSSIDGQHLVQATKYFDNTWYRLVITGAANRNVRASLFADDGTTELIGQTFGFNTTSFPSGFEIGLGQESGVPNGPYPVDVAIDYLRLTTSVVPEPPAGVLILFGVALCGPIVFRRRCNQTIP